MKTLKDLEWTSTMAFEELGRRLKRLETNEKLNNKMTEGNHVDSIEIREEAKKWIWMKNDIAFKAPETMSEEQIKISNMSWEDIFKHFFNLEEKP